MAPCFDHVGVTVSDLMTAVRFLRVSASPDGPSVRVEGEFIDTVDRDDRASTEIVMSAPR